MKQEMPPEVSLPKEEEIEETTHEGSSGIQQIVNKERRIRQAVVVIHGVGEQRPMDTLRSFVDAVLVDEQKTGYKYYNKPDAMNELLEMRCLQAPFSRQTSRPLTDFYEYYWAHHVEGSKYAQVIFWLWELMMRRPKNIPPALRPVYFVSWVLMIFAAGLWLWGLGGAGTGYAPFIDGLKQQKWFFAGGLISILMQWVCSHFLLGFVADAARYLKPSPDNIKVRNAIRSEGIKLLRALHDSGRYNRIVVVGHSLGAVIGYDIIRNLWVDLRKPTVLYPQKQPELKAFKGESDKMEEGAANPAKIEVFQQSQHRLWQEFRRLGIPWLVTDFVTLGAPLAHAQLLMADNPDGFVLKKGQYEYPCCPPCGNEALYYDQQYRLGQGDSSVIRNMLMPHHGAPFCCTRWTNLYFPYRRFILGDLIGGPLNGIFGKGIRDIAVVPSTNHCLDRTLISHMRYWAGSEKAPSVDDRDGKPALETLRKMLRLDFLRGKSAKARPGAHS